MNDLINKIFDKHFSSIGKEARPEQRQVIASILAGHNTLSIMPTGGGKSLCYWVAGLALKGTTLVIFPLTALMDEQALKLRSHGLDVTVLHSGIPAKKQYNELISLYNGNLPDFIFTSPERLATDGFFEHVLIEKREHIKLVVVDEIHCISQWGHDFRPFYTEIPPFLDTIFGSNENWPTILGLTATLNQKDTEEVCNDFHIAAANVLKSQYLLRYPIQVNVTKVDDEIDKDQRLWTELGKHKDEKVLVYVDNRRSGDRSTEGMSARAIDEGYSAVFFHSNMSSAAKAEVIRQFKEGEIKTVFATSAFGMGIDIPDIRGVIHYRPPESIEQYYQQIGRVGRDGAPSWALLFYSDKNIQFRKTYFIDPSFPNRSDIENAFAKLTAGHGDVKTFNYFGEDDAQSAFHYLIRGEALKLRCKSVERINIFTKSTKGPLPKFEQYQAATRTGLTVLVAKKSQHAVEEVTYDIFKWLAKQQIKTNRSPSKCLIIEQLLDDLPENNIEDILADVEEKRQYRYGLLDELAELLNQFNNSIEFHQKIGKYLGVDKLQMRRIHQTVSGEMVRSKSEVIIANLLTKHQVPFQYEDRLEAEGYGFWPDFTVTVGGKTYYWEHLGMLDLEQYRQNWEIKRAWYERNFPNQLLTTEESSTLSRISENMIVESLSTNDTKTIPSDGEVDSIIKLIARGESSKLEFKSTFQYDLKTKKKADYLRESVIKTVAAYLNTDGGILLIGVDDKGEILGLDDDLKFVNGKSLDKFELTLNSVLTQSIGKPFTQFFQVRFIEVNGKTICRIDAKAASKPNFVNDETFYIRSGNAINSLVGADIYDYVNMHWPKGASIYPALNEGSSGTSSGKAIIAKVWTEGVTDWKHLKAAFNRLKADERIQDFDIDFQQDEEPMGDKELLSMCRNLSRFQQPQPTFLIFDRDVIPTLKRITDQDQDYKDWGNGVYSIALPVPAHRMKTKDISIEFYYHDDEIRTLDKNGRRMFIGTEFNNRTGIHESEQYVCQDRNKQGKYIIIDNHVFDFSADNEQNVALSKNAFATNVYEQVNGFDNFDVTPFLALFHLVKRLCESDARKNTLTTPTPQA